MSEVMAVMKVFPHVYAETNWLATVDAVEITVEELGADRILYGSSAPMRSMQKALNEVLETEPLAGDERGYPGGKCHTVARHRAAHARRPARTGGLGAQGLHGRKSSTSIRTWDTGPAPAAWRTTIRPPCCAA